MSLFVMPSLGADMEAGILVERLRQVGDPVKRGDVIAAVETQKGVIEIEVFEDGVLDAWLVDLGTQVDVGAPLARISQGAEGVAEPDVVAAPREADVVAAPREADVVAAPQEAATRPGPKPEPKPKPEPQPEPFPQIPEPGPAPDPDRPAPPETPQPSDPAPRPAPPEVPAPPGTPAPPVPPVPPMPEPPDPALPDLPQARPAGGHRQRASPAARRLAARTGLDLRRVAPRHGTAISRADVAAMAARHEASPAHAPQGGASPTNPPQRGAAVEADRRADDRSPPSDRAASATQTPMREAIAAAMTRSNREIPHYYLSHDIDLTAVDSFVTAANADLEPADRLLPAVCYVKAMARAAAKFPEMNGHYREGRFQASSAVHAGLAINLRSGGLVAPALFDADQLPLPELMQSLRDLVARVRQGRFRARELSDATLTLSSLGNRGVDRLFGVIYPPQVAIVGIGKAALRPAVHGNAVAPRLMATLTLAADHRVSDGHRGAMFLRAMDTHLQSPETL